ncbi:MAG: oxidoreductase [Gemmobacter sp.]
MDHDREPPSARPVNRHRRRMIAAGVAALAASALSRPLSAASALSGAPLPAPVGPVVLRIEGAIELRNTPDAATFDDAMLLDLPQVGFTTSTIWTPQPEHFSGPPLGVVLDCVAARGTRLIAIAANEYRAEIAYDEVDEMAPILAIRRNGQPFGLRQRGPIWLVFPFDSEPRYRNERIYSQSVWQLTTLSVLDG